MADNRPPGKVFNYFEKYLGTLLKARGHDMEQIFLDSEKRAAADLRKARENPIVATEMTTDSKKSGQE